MIALGLLCCLCISDAQSTGKDCVNLDEVFTSYERCVGRRRARVLKIRSLKSTLSTASYLRDFVGQIGFTEASCHQQKQLQGLTED
jgi:hypothetical protein